MSTTEKPAPAKATKKATATEYVVLALYPEGDWRNLDSVKAADPSAAIKLVLDSHDTPHPTALVAVPARSWQPVKQKTTTKTITTLEPLT